MDRLALSLAAVLVIASPAQARIVFSINDGPDKIVTGKGGARVVSHGIDWWTGGDPARRYEIIGILTDSRGTGAFSGKVIGSKTIASKVKAAGGNAVILYKTSDADVDSLTYLEPGRAYSSGADTAIRSSATVRSTSFVVVKVLD